MNLHLLLMTFIDEHFERHHKEIKKKDIIKKLKELEEATDLVLSATERKWLIKTGKIYSKSYPF